MSLTHSADLSSGGLPLIFSQMGGSANAHGTGRPFFVGFCGADIGKAGVLLLGGILMKTADKLRKFRQDCEREARAPAHQIEVPLLHLLNDVCTALQLTPRNTKKVLGRKGVQRLVTERQWTAELVDKKTN